MPATADRPRWKLLINSRKPHLFVGGRSLCCRYLYLGNDYDGEWTGEINESDCRACVKKAQRSHPVKS